MGSQNWLGTAEVAVGGFLSHASSPRLAGNSQGKQARGNKHESVHHCCCPQLSLTHQKPSWRRTGVAMDPFCPWITRDSSTGRWESREMTGVGTCYGGKRKEGILTSLGGLKKSIAAAPVALTERQGEG